VGGALLAGGAAWAVHAYGPRFGVYLVPPSPQAYAEQALDLAGRGLRAEGGAWDAAAERVRAEAADARTYADLYPALADAVAVAGGKHSAFLSPDEATTADAAGTGAAAEPSVVSAGGVTTVTVPETDAGPQDAQTAYATTLAAGIGDAAPATCGWIVDLRGNTGGTMYPMLSGVAPLLPDGPALTFRDRSGRTAVSVTVQADGAGLGGRTGTRVPEVPKVAGQPVAVLQDGRTGSSGEAVLAAFRGLPDVRTFGAPSAGYTSANTPYRLYDGAVLVVTESVYVDRDGTPLTEEPLAPDQEADDAAAAATAWLSERGCA
jgi:hypothetical protein